MILPQRLILISFTLFPVSWSAFKKIYLLRSSEGDRFTWDGSCDTLDATAIYYKQEPACACTLEGLDGTYYNGSFFRSNRGNYKCYYGMGEMAGGSFMLGANSCTNRSSNIATFDRKDGKIIYLGDDLFIASSLKIRSVQYFSYESPPLKETVNPFRLTNKSEDSTQQQQAVNVGLYSFKLRWRPADVFSLYAGHMLRVLFQSSTVDKYGYWIEKNHSLILKIPGKREYFFSSEEQYPSTTPPLSTTPSTGYTSTVDFLDRCFRDATCSEYYSKWEDLNYRYEDLNTLYYAAKNESSTLAVNNARKDDIIIGIGVACGVLFLIIIILIILLCCRDGCCRKEEKPPESLVISSQSPMFIPPRRNTGDKPPVAPARTHPGAPLNKKGGPKKRPEQPLYESIHRRNDLYETPIDGGGSSPYQFESLNREIYQDAGYIDPL